MSPFALLFALGAGIGANNSVDEAARKDVAFLEGKWALIAGQRDGAIVPGFMVRTAQCTAVGNESTLIMSGRVYMKARHSLDPSKQLKAIDYDVLEGELRGQRQEGIYEINGNTVKICFAAPGLPRPTDFTAPAGSGRTYTAWQKISGPGGAEVDPASASGTTYEMDARPRLGFRPLLRLSQFANNVAPVRRTLPLLGRLLPR